MVVEPGDPLDHATPGAQTMHIRQSFPGRIAVLAGACLAAGCAAASDAHVADPASVTAGVEAWRTARLEKLHQEGWLTLVGLHWLEEGRTTFGADSANDLVFPEPAAPHLGTFTLRGDDVEMEVAPGIDGVTFDGRPVRRLRLTSDRAAPVAHFASISWHVIARRDRYGVRVRDAEAETLTAFPGLRFFPIDPAWYRPATFQRYDPPKSIDVPNILGYVTEQPSPGAVVFEVEGEAYRLDVTGDPDDEAFFIAFADRTNGAGTYGGGRFIWIDAPDSSGTTFIDFNRSYNPPCVFTPYATCPLPPRQNRLALTIEAGELDFHAPAH